MAFTWAEDNSSYLRFRSSRRSLGDHHFAGVNANGVHTPDPKLLQNTPQNPRYPHSHTTAYEYYRMWDRVQKNITGNVANFKYYFAIIAVFRNEEFGMKEWLEHHLGTNAK